MKFRCALFDMELMREKVLKGLSLGFGLQAIKL